LGCVIIKLTEVQDGVEGGGGRGSDLRYCLQFIKTVGGDMGVLSTIIKTLCWEHDVNID